VNRAVPDAELEDFVNALAARIGSFDKLALANTKRLVNEARLPRRRDQRRLGRLHCFPSVWSDRPLWVVAGRGLTHTISWVTE